MKDQYLKVPVTSYSRPTDTKGLEEGTRKNPKKKAKRTDRNTFGSARGVETLFRNAYRAQLDLITLAATKANIMISVNGFIASVLMVSGAFIFATDPLFVPPAIIFLTTAAASMFFAILAADPGATKTKRQLQDFLNKEANILIFQDYAQLSKQDYMKCMEALLSDNKQIYASMADQLYWLGGIADKKFRMLRYSYTIFRWGITASIFMLLIILLYAHTSSPKEVPVAYNPAPTTEPAKFEQIYEPSAVQQLADGRIVVIEDEPKHAVSIVTINNDKRLSEETFSNRFLVGVNNLYPDDLEGVAVDAKGYVYAITSHAQTKKGKRRNSREQLIRLKIDQNRIVEKKVFSRLMDHMALPGHASNTAGNKLIKTSVNIEAISFDKQKKRLLIGFRAPLFDDKAMILVLENPMGIFERGEDPRFSNEITLLDLQGGGIRSLVYDPNLEGYLLLSKIDGQKGKERSKLWFWDGGASHSPHAFKVPDLKKLKNAEGLAPVTVAGEKRILIVSDDGKSVKNKPAHYLLLSYDQL